ncbi:undecaprenyl-diphosphatase [Clostridia bacterium]|nr:undecaprenyl-diphosphatase [Clostridia bacterium]
MAIWFAALLGLIQGLTEFLPVSSSGHLAIFQYFFGMDGTDYILFDVLLHLATLIAIVTFYRRDIGAILRDLFGLISGKNKFTPAVRLLLLLLVATLPLFVFVLFADTIEGLSQNIVVIGVALLVTSALLFLSGRIPKGNKSEKSATFADALIVGLSQGIATVPGLSRSGTTISAGLFRKFDRGFAVKFSFLMSIPAVLGAAVFKVSDAVSEGFELSQLPPYLLGMLVAGAVGYAALTWLKKLADKGFGIFAVYCAVAGAATLIASFIF